MPPRTSTTRLPASLRDQIDQDPTRNTRRRPKQLVSRKEARKTLRQEQKQRKVAFFSQHKSTHSQVNRKRPRDHSLEHDQRRPAKKLCTSGTSSGPSLNGPYEDGTSASISLRESYANVQKQSTPSTSRSNTSLKISGRRPPAKDLPRRSREENLEDARIAWLEAKLETDRSKNGKKKSNFFGDGLDDLLEGLDRIVPIPLQQLETPSEVESSNEYEYESFKGFSDAEDTTKEDVEESDVEVVNGGVESHHIDRLQETVPIVSDSASNVSQSGKRYTPHDRQCEADSLGTLSKLSRQLKGLLNRLSEQNMNSILSSIEQIYHAHRRHDITSTLTKIMLDSISSHTLLLDSFVVLHASLIASLHRIIGVELAAHFVQHLVASYEDNYRALRTSDTSDMDDDETKGGKGCLNLVVLVSELYNLQVISCVLVYDILRGLLENLDEFDVELLLKVVRNSGQQLRQDDPSALKDIIQMVQSKMNSREQSTISSRTRFMIETLTNLKNNKVKRSLDQDGRSETMERMKKFLSGLNKKYHILAHEPLRITLQDLHSSEKKGKWWLVGSAWSGNPLLDRVQAMDRQATIRDPAKQAADALVQLSRTQGMNTDVRRSIFVVLMSSDDYIDACDRLSQLKLTEVQQREIVRVILHCLGNERVYNPYYTLVVQQLCRTSHSYKVTLQFCLWDFLRTLGEKSVGGAEIIKNLQDDDPPIDFDVKTTSSPKLFNIARAYGWWLAKDCLTLTVLKPVDFTVLQPRGVEFFHALFSQLFISTQVTSPVIAPNEEVAGYLIGSRSREALETVFIKATRVPLLTQGLIYFLMTPLRGEDGPSTGVLSETLRWAREVAKDTLRTGMDVMA